MKKVQFLATTVLATSIFGGVVSQAAEANKAPQKLDTNAHVKFIQDEEGGEITEPPVYPGEPEEPIEPHPGGETPSEKAPLMITFAPNFEFGEIKIASKAITQPAQSQIKTAKGNDVPHFVQIEDNRGAHTGWTLSVTPSALAEVENADSKLDSPFISLGSVNLKGNSDIAATSTLKNILFNNEPQEVMAAATGGEGAWTAIFGTEDDLTGEEGKKVNSAVNLNIGAKDMAKVSAADYSSTLTWNLTGNNAGTLSATPSK